MENFGFALRKNSIFNSTAEERLKLAQVDIISHFILRLAYINSYTDLQRIGIRRNGF